MRRRLLPSPALSAALFGAWLMLAGSASVGQMLLGALLALALPLLTASLRPEPAHLRRPAVLGQLALRVLGDIVRSNLLVAAQVLGPERALRPQFVCVPLDLRSAQGIATLMSIVTMTPGTLSAWLDDDRRRLWVHALSTDDAVALVAEIKSRYETPLQEIFE